MPDVRAGAEGRQLAVGVRRRLVVFHVEQIDDDRPDVRADHLRGDVAGDLVPGEPAGQRDAEGDGRVDVCAARLAHTQHGGVDRESPAGADDDPAGAVSLGAVEHHVGHHIVAQEYQDGGAQQLREIDVHRVPRRRGFTGEAQRAPWRSHYRWPSGHAGGPSNSCSHPIRRRTLFASAGIRRVGQFGCGTRPRGRRRIWQEAGCWFCGWQFW